MTTVAIHQPQYLPYLGFFHKLKQCDLFVALDHVQYQRRGVQNRNKIKTKDGWQWLTVPVCHQEEERINNIEIDPKMPWQRKHWKAIEFSYSPAPFFDEYAADLKRLLLDQTYRLLCDLNMTLLQWMMERLDIEVPILYSSQLEVDGNKSDLLISICQAVGADCYLSGPGGRRYMDLDAFKAAGIAVQWQEFTSPVYPQVFPQAGFVPDLSALDVLFNCGPQTADWLV